MGRRTYPRPEHHHAATANQVLAHHEALTGERVALPVPVEMVIELTYDLAVLWEDIAEPSGATILGALLPLDRQIVINTRHTDLFDRVIGPERFTLAHELAHWIYDADDPNQLTLNLHEGASEQFCYCRESPGLGHESQLREVNANKLASHLLLPEHLVRAADLDEIRSTLRETAAAWGVSHRALRIRLGTLGLLDDRDEAQQLDLG